MPSLPIWATVGTYTEKWARPSETALDPVRYLAERSKFLDYKAALDDAQRVEHALSQRESS